MSSIDWDNITSKVSTNAHPAFGPALEVDPGIAA